MNVSSYSPGTPPAFLPKLGGARAAGGPTNVSEALELRMDRKPFLSCVPNLPKPESQSDSLL